MKTIEAFFCCFCFTFLVGKRLEILSNGSKGERTKVMALMAAEIKVANEECVDWFLK